MLASSGISEDLATRTELEVGAASVALAGKPTIHRRGDGSVGRYLPVGESNGDIVVYVGERERRGQAMLGIEVVSPSAPTPLDQLFGRDTAMQAFKHAAVTAAEHQIDVLLLGPSGAGKQVAARALHEMSGRTGDFVELDCTQLRNDNAESEIFGHVRGAFTGAHAPRTGVFEAADGGTLFIDEIGELPLAIQAKFLKVLDKHEVRPMGADATRKPKLVQVWVIAATNRNLEQMVASGAFREDLYYRLKNRVLRLPALCERGADIVGTAQHVLAQLCAEYGCTPHGLTEAAKDAIRSYAWPGNVRQLRACLLNAAQLRDQEWIDVPHLELPQGEEPTRAVTLLPPAPQTERSTLATSPNQPSCSAPAQPRQLTPKQIEDFLHNFFRNWPKGNTAKEQRRLILSNVLINVGKPTGKPSGWVKHLRSSSVLARIPGGLVRPRLSEEEADALADAIISEAGADAERDELAQAAAVLLGAGDKAPQLVRVARSALDRGGRS